MESHHHHQPHISIPSTPAVAAAAGPFDFPIPLLKKHRGSYNCGRCGLPKRGHICNLPSSSTTTTTPSTTTSSSSTSRPPPIPRPNSSLRRALSFDDFDVPSPSNPPHSPYTYIHLDVLANNDDDDDDDDAFWDHESLANLPGRLPSPCLWDVLRRLPPTDLLAAAMVCKSWRDTSRTLWRAAQELHLGVPSRAPFHLVGSLLNKCPSLVRLSLRFQRFPSAFPHPLLTFIISQFDISYNAAFFLYWNCHISDSSYYLLLLIVITSDLDATLLACIAFSCSNLEHLHISTSPSAVNRITGYCPLTPLHTFLYPII